MNAEVGRIQDLRDDDIGKEEFMDALPGIAIQGQTANTYAPHQLSIQLTRP